MRERLGWSRRGRWGLCRHSPLGNKKLKRMAYLTPISFYEGDIPTNICSPLFTQISHHDLSLLATTDDSCDSSFDQLVLHSPNLNL